MLCESVTNPQILGTRSVHYELRKDTFEGLGIVHFRLYCPKEVNRRNWTNSKNRPRCRPTFYFGYQTNRAF